MKQKVLLIILLSILAGALANAFLRSPRPEEVSFPGEGRRDKTNDRGADPASVVAEGEFTLHLDVLNRKEETSPGVQRNLFGPLFTVRPAPAPKRPAPAPEKPEIAPAPTLPLPPPPSFPSVSTREKLAKFIYMGFLEQEGQRTVFLSARDEIFLVREGDRFGENGEFFVHSLTPQELVIHRDNDPRPLHIALVEKETLIPIMKAPAVRRRDPLPPLPQPPVSQADDSMKKDKSLNDDQNTMPKS